MHFNNKSSKLWLFHIIKKKHLMLYFFFFFAFVFLLQTELYVVQILLELLQVRNAYLSPSPWLPECSGTQNKNFKKKNFFFVHFKIWNSCALLDHIYIINIMNYYISNALLCKDNYGFNSHYILGSTLDKININNEHQTSTDLSYNI